MGWMGVYSNVKHTLRMYGAKFENGEPVFTQAPPFFFLGIKDDNNDVVISDDCRCEMQGGGDASVAALLNSTSYGIRGVKVI